MSTIYVDIETIPDMSVPESELRAGISAPSNYKDPAKIREYIEDKAAGARAEMALDAAAGVILCMGIAVDDDPVQVFSNGLGTRAGESLMLDAVSRYLDGASSLTPRWVAHNADFDLAFLSLAALRHTSPIGRWLPKGSAQVVDTMWRTRPGMRPGADKRISLDALCKVLGIAGKDGLTGADVFPAWQEGRIEEIELYCAADVERCRQILTRCEEVLR